MGCNFDGFSYYLQMNPFILPLGGTGSTGKLKSLINLSYNTLSTTWNSPRCEAGSL
jgi:hypothetical protein